MTHLVQSNIHSGGFTFQVNNIYQHPSLGVNIEIVVTSIIIMDDDTVSKPCNLSRHLVFCGQLYSIKYMDMPMWNIM